MIQGRKRDKGKRRQETWWKTSVCVRSVGDKQVYLCKQRTAAKHRPPRVWLRIQRYKKLAQTHSHTHVQWLCQSHIDVQSIPEACHKHTVTCVNLVRGGEERHRMTSNHSVLQFIRNSSCPRITSPKSEQKNDWRFLRTEIKVKRISDSVSWGSFFFFHLSCILRVCDAF